MPRPRHFHVLEGASPMPASRENARAKEDADSFVAIPSEETLAGGDGIVTLSP